MAICENCNQEMTAAATISCVQTPVVLEAGEFAPVRYKPENSTLQRCHDCNILAGGFHHPGCDWERCPNCKGQLISCDCYRDGDEEFEEFNRDLQKGIFNGEKL